MVLDMKKGIVVLSLLLLVLSSAFADEFDDIGQPPGVGAPGSIQGSPPDVQITAPTGGTVTSPVTVTVSATDDGTVAKVQLFVDNVKHNQDLTVAPYTFSVTLAAGSHTLRAVATDNENEAGESAVVTVSIGGGTGGGGGADTTLPTVSITNPTSGSFSCSVTVDVVAADNIGVDRVELFVGSLRKATDTASPYSFTLDISTMLGARTLTAKAFDAAGNRKDSTPVTITVTTCGECNPFESFCDIPDPGGGGSTPDTTAPQITAMSPVDGTTVRGVVPVTVTASDNIGVARVEFFVGTSTTPKVTDTSSPFGFDLNTITDGLTGPQTIKAKAFDAAGNNVERIVNVVVDNTAAQDTVLPVISIDSPTDPATVTTDVSVIVTATDDTRVAKVDFFLGTDLKNTVTVADLVTGKYLFQLVVAGLTGTNVLKAVAQDEAGNIAEDTVTITIQSATGGTGTGGSGTTSDSGSSTPSGGSDSRTYRNYQQTRGIKRGTDTDIVAPQPVFNSPIANPVIPVPRTQPVQPIQSSPIFEPIIPLVEDEPVQLWVVFVASTGALLVLGLAVAFVVHLLHKKVPEDVISYVRSNIEQGYAPEVLEETLVQQGWSQKIAQRAVSAAQNV